MESPTVDDLPQLRLTQTATTEAPRSSPRRLGVLGGSYNPITLAHLRIADAVVDAFQLHEVLFCLPQVPPHKSIFGATLDQRLDMMQAAVADRPYATVGLCSHGLFIDIYRALQAVYPPDLDVYMITGRDAAERILTWRYDDTEAALRQMFTSFELIVFDRDGVFEMPSDPLLTPYDDRIHHCSLRINLDHVSSTDVRTHLQQQASIEPFVPDSVADYIQRHNLYRDE